MITLRMASRKHMASREPKRPEFDAPGSPRMFWFVVVILAGYLLFAHGCHADEDTELRVNHYITALLRQHVG